MALIAVAVVGLSHSASADVDGKIYVTNVASTLTTESPAPSGRTTASTVYGTYADSDVRNIVTSSDKFIVTIVDADENETTDVVSDATAGNGYQVTCDASCADVDGDGNALADANVIDLIGSGFNAAGEQVQITLDDSAGSPIIGDVSTVSVVLASDDETPVSGVSVKAINFAGDDDNDAIITIGIDFGTGPGAETPITILYSSSDVDTVTATVKSIVDPTGATLTLTETGRNTGRFEGYAQITKHDADNNATATAGGASGDPLEIPAVGGPITIKYTDAANANGSSSTRTALVLIDTTPPTATISSPSTGAETQNRKPNFTGNVSDHQSGIDVGSFGLYIDQSDDEGNDDAIIADDGTLLADVGGNVAANKADIDTSATSDGAKTMSFSHTPSDAIPGEFGSNPDHLVDFQVRVADLAGNYGYSDADTSSADDGPQGNKAHTVKIDQIIPQMSNAYAGVGYDAEDDEDEPNVRDTVKVAFDGKLNAASVSASDFKITLSGAGGVFVPANVLVKGSVVYLDIDSTIPSDNTPTVTLQGTIQDLAGNSTSAGSAIADDDLAPVITVTRSGGTGIGTGSEGADSLTSGSLVVTVSSDEDLGSPPVITVTDLGDNPTVGDVLDESPGVAQGGNVWKFTIAGGGANVNRAISIEATDLASNVTSYGSDSVKAYTVDTAVADPTSSPEHEGDTTQSNPFITTDYSDDQSTLTVVSATLDDVDVTSSVVASADKKKFFLQPTTALSNGDHTYVIKVKDAAGNESTTTTTFTKASRTDFVITLFAGWNAVSVPSNPIDSSIGSVFSNSGVKQVVAYDATTPAQPWRIASKVDGSFSSQTNPGLTSVHAGHGYWVESGDFENQKVALEGPTGPGDARPGLTTIPVGSGWNFIGVVDQSRIQTQSYAAGTTLTRTGSDGDPDDVTQGTYFSNQNIARSYTFNTVTSKFQTLTANDNVKIGSGIWAFISPQDNGKLPHIVP